MNHLWLISAETNLFAAALERAAPDAPVPTCPGWTADDLLWHLTEVHAFWAGILREGALTDEDSEAVEAAKPERPADREELFELLQDETAALVAELSVRRPDEAAWSWFPTDQTAGFTRRMQVHEATMHRVDAELTAGVASQPIDPEVAADGVAHAVEVMFAWWGTNPGFEFVPGSGLVSFVMSDAPARLVQPGRWQGVGQSGKSYDVPAMRFVEAGEPTASISGAAEDLYRWLWGRGAEPEASGDTHALAAVREVVAQGMQ